MQDSCRCSLLGSREPGSESSPCFLPAQSLPDSPGAVRGRTLCTEPPNAVLFIDSIFTSQAARGPCLSGSCPHGLSATVPSQLLEAGLGGLKGFSFVITLCRHSTSGHQMAAT